MSALTFSLLDFCRTATAPSEGISSTVEAHKLALDAEFKLNSLYALQT